MTGSIQRENPKKISGILVEYSEDLYSSGINLSALIAFVSENSRLLLLSAIAGLAFGFGASYAIPKSYVSNSLLAIREQTDGISIGVGVPSGLSGLARSVGLKDSSAPSEKWVAFMKSEALGQEFVTQQNLVESLAPESVFHRYITRSTGEKERSKSKLAYKVFDNKIRRVRVDERTGLVTLGMRWRDPTTAAKLVGAYVDFVNKKISQREIEDAEQNLKYLRAAWKDSDQVSVRAAVAHVTEVQMNRLMLAKSRADFAFEVIEPANVRDETDFDSPQRIVFAALGGFALLLAGLVFAYRRHR